MGLPRDLFTEAQTHQIMVESGIESVETAIRELKGFEGDTLQNELERIGKQNEMSQAQMDEARKQIPEISL